MVVTDSFSNQFRGSVRGAAAPRESGGLSMASATRDRVKPSRNRQGSQTLEILHLLDRQIPCIFLTDIIQPETVAELITEGAADCIGMDHVGHLPVAIRRTL